MASGQASAYPRGTGDQFLDQTLQRHGSYDGLHSEETF